jgi:DNA-binding NtrC family response regulator
MSEGLDVIIIDDDESLCRVISQIIKKFYTWGDIFTFTNADEAISYCLSRDTSVALFIVDVFLGEKSGFSFLDAISEKFPTAHEDTIMITGYASDDVVNMCVASDVHHLLEKPLKPYALQLAVRAIVAKYLKFAEKLLRDPSFADSVPRF